jgi:hypothetical protein
VGIWRDFASEVAKILTNYITLVSPPSFFACSNSRTAEECWSGLWWHIRRSGKATAWTLRCSNPGRGKRVFTETSRPALVPTQLPIQWVPGREEGLELTARLHLVQRLWMSGVIPLLPLHPFIAWTGTPSPVCLYFIPEVFTAVGGIYWTVCIFSNLVATKYIDSIVSE